MLECRLPLVAAVVGADSALSNLEGDWIRVNNHLAYVRSQRDDAVSTAFLQRKFELLLRPVHNILL